MSILFSLWENSSIICETQVMNSFAISTLNWRSRQYKQMDQNLRHSFAQKISTQAGGGGTVVRSKTVVRKRSRSQQGA